VVSFGGKPAAIEDHEIAGLQQAVACGQGLVPLATFVAGAGVVITQGPLRGVRGVVVGMDAKQYIVISITMLGRCVAVELRPEWVRSQHPAPDYHFAYAASTSRHVARIA
jgi:transcription antitermination factor NusG